MRCREVSMERSGIMTSGLRAVALSAAVLVVLGAARLSAQETAQTARTHVVKRGDTLWDLARLYLGDPYLWPEIYRLNTDVIDDPHWIYPSEVLKLPAPGSTPTVAEGPKPEAEPPAAVPQGAPVAAAPTPAPTAPPTSAPVESPSGELSGPTVFPKQINHVDPAKQRVRAAAPAPAIRIGEFLSAPFIDREGGPRGAGAILKAVNLSVSASGRDPKARLQLHDDLLIAPPVGSAAPEGERYVTYAIGPYVEDLGQVIIPTGIIEVTRAPRSGEAAIAQVVHMFAEIQADQQLMPYDSTSLQIKGRAQPVGGASWASVKFIPSSAVLPTIQDFLVLDVSSRDGIKVGDEFLLFEPRRNSDGDHAEPEISIARAQAVRVTPYATTLMITGERHPKIEKGTMARRIATMP